MELLMKSVERTNEAATEMKVDEEAKQKAKTLWNLYTFSFIWVWRREQYYAFTFSYRGCISQRGVMLKLNSINKETFRIRSLICSREDEREREIVFVCPNHFANDQIHSMAKAKQLMKWNESAQTPKPS